jgi:hypothetical protein
MPEQQTLDFGEVAEARSAVISDDGLYRYRLDRRWADGPRVTWVMLNPSTANAEVEDPTSRRVIRFSRAWGYGALTIVNLYAWRATDPVELWFVEDPVGPENDRYLAEACAGTDVIAAWGASGHVDRIREVLALPGMDGLKALALTQSGQPRHPLYLRGNLTPEPWVNPDA